MLELTTTPITPGIGAIVRNLKLSPDLGEETINAIRVALSNHLVLVFPEQNPDVSELRDFTAHFGPVFLHHKDEGVIHSEGVPEVLEMVKEATGNRLFGGSDWHADVTFRNPGALLSVLHAQELPPCGGDTGFANTINAYRALSPGMQALAQRLDAVHSYSGRGQPDHPTETAIHPVVKQHPITGEKGLYINRMFATRFQGMTPEESEPLIDFFDRHMTRPEFTCRISWQVGQVVIWDNRFTLHYPINDFTGYRRRLLRCTAMCEPT